MLRVFCHNKLAQQRFAVVYTNVFVQTILIIHLQTNMGAPTKYACSEGAEHTQ